MSEHGKQAIALYAGLTLGCIMSWTYGNPQFGAAMFGACLVLVIAFQAGKYFGGDSR